MKKATTWIIVVTLLVLVIVWGVMGIDKKRFGKNAILKGMNFEKGATARDRNEQIGGHKA